MIVLKNVLVPTDFGPPSAQALRYGRHFARQFGARLHVMHTIESLLVPGGAEVPVAAIAQVEAGLDAVARKQMAEALTDEERAGDSVVTVIRPARSAANDIVEYARAEGIDLIVMGTHGRGALEHLLMGSVAERVVRWAPCPVLTVRTEEREFVAGAP
jgi:nucleotide-binding universal stress UspA family protein